MSPLLQTSVRECIEHMNERNSARDNLRFEYTTVRYPDLAIVGGAVIFGAASAALVTHRVSRLTYAYETNIELDGSNPEHRRRASSSLIRTVNGTTYIGVLYTYIRAGQEVPAGFTTERNHNLPLTETQTGATFPLFASRSESIHFRDEPGVKQLGSVTVPVDTSLPLAKRRVSSELEFGGTEIKVHGYDHTGRRADTAQLSFDLS
jgi:hypothetical protein